uniref:Uncharacterized protein n=1 Tax=Arundo donax TaxID=35708 RepID=A0A0A8ZAI1_ARUDO
MHTELFSFSFFEEKCRG